MAIGYNLLNMYKVLQQLLMACPSSATGADDFAGITSANANPVNFPPQSLSTVVQVAIQDDTAFEGAKQFFVRLRSNGAIPNLNISVDKATVQILDDEGMSVLHITCRIFCDFCHVIIQ